MKKADTRITEEAVLGGLALEDSAQCLGLLGWLFASNQTARQPPISSGNMLSMSNLCGLHRGLAKPERVYVSAKSCTRYHSRSL